jgi:putative transcriptional regulator
LLENIKPYIQAFPGGFYVCIDSEKLKRVRKKKKISLGSVARAIGVSRKAIQLYEQGMKLEVTTALRLERYLKESLVMPVDLFSFPVIEKEYQDINTRELNFFKRLVFRLLAKLGYEVLPTTKCPFDGVTKTEKEMFITCIDKCEASLVKKVSLITSISRVANLKCVFFVKSSERENFYGVPIVSWDNLKGLSSAEEVTSLILERAEK